MLPDGPAPVEHGPVTEEDGLALCDFSTVDPAPDALRKEESRGFLLYGTDSVPYNPKVDPDRRHQSDWRRLSVSTTGV